MTSVSASSTRIPPSPISEGKIVIYFLRFIEIVNLYTMVRSTKPVSGRLNISAEKSGKFIHNISINLDYYLIMQCTINKHNIYKLK